MNDKITHRRPGLWLLISIGILLNIMYLLGQTMALINYDFAVSLGLQEASDQITQVGVALNKGFGLGDTVFYMPLFIAGIIGLIRRSPIGLYAMTGALAITVYWPIVSMATLLYAEGSPGWQFSDISSYAVILAAITLYGLWGLFYLFRQRYSLVNS